MNRRRKKSVILLITLSTLVFLVITEVAILSRSLNELNLVRRYKEQTQAFWLAEAAVEEAKRQISTNSNISGTGLFLTSLGQGQYDVDITKVNDEYNVTGYGYIPSKNNSRVERSINVVLKKPLPAGFYDNAIYTAGEAEFKGNAYSVLAKDADPNNPAVRYADELDAQHPENIVGTTTQDASISPLFRFNFSKLLAISQQQGNVYDAQRLNDVSQGNDSFPSSFWYVPPADPSDPTTGVPNVVYIYPDGEEFSLNGNIGTIGGFILVVGDVINNSDLKYEVEINGNGQIEGAIYTLGEFEVNGGGNNLNVNGGIWSGEEVELKGASNISYNENYMRAIEALGVDVSLTLLSWQDNQNPFSISP